MSHRAPLPGLLALRRRHTAPPRALGALGAGWCVAAAPQRRGVWQLLRIVQLAGCEWVSKHDDEFQICSEAATMDPNHVVLIKDEDSDDELLCAPTVLPHLSHLQLDAMAMRWRRDGDAMAT